MNKNQQLKVDIVNNRSKVKNNNAFANSFVFSDDLSNDNQFVGLRQTLNIKEENPKQSNIIMGSDPKPSKLSKQQTKPAQNQSNIQKNNIKQMMEEQKYKNNQSQQQRSPRKNKHKKRRLFDQQQMNNTFMLEPQQPYGQKNKTDLPKKQSKESPNKKVQMNKQSKESPNKKGQGNNGKFRNQYGYEEQDTQEIKHKNVKQKNKDKAKHQTIEIDQHLPKYNQKLQQNIQKNQSPSQKPSKLTKNTVHIQTVQSPQKQYKKGLKKAQQKKGFTIIENPQKDKQMTKISQIASNHRKINNDIKDIKQNYDSIEQQQQEILFRKHNPKKQEQIRDFLMRKRMEKEHRQKKINQIRQREKQEMMRSIEQSEEIKRKQKEEKIRQIKQVDYVKPKRKRESMQVLNQQGTRLAQSLIQKYRNHEPIHMRKQREFQLIKQKQQQEQQQLLLQRKRRYQSLDLQQLQQHKREYQERKQQMEFMKKEQREEFNKKINEDNQLMKDHIWKGQSHDLVDEELMEKKRKKREPKEKVRKMKKYYQYVKQNLLPRTHQPKRYQQTPIDSLINYSSRYQPSPNQQVGYDPHNNKLVKKFKYYQGRAVGQVIQTVPVARSYSEQKQIGQQYLQHLKSLPKKRNISESTTQIDPIDLQMISKKFNAVTKVKRDIIPFYQNQTQKRTVSISAKPTKEQVKLVHDQLINQDLKIKSKIQLIRVMKQNSPSSLNVQKQVNAGMLLNMERKLDLLAKL